MYRTLSALKAHGFLIQTNDGVYEWQDAQLDDDAATVTPDLGDMLFDGAVVDMKAATEARRKREAAVQ